MFNRIRLKLTLVNVAVVGVIFIILMTSVYVITSNNIRKQSAQMMMAAARDAGNSFPGQVNSRPRPWVRYNIFFVRIGFPGQDVYVSPNASLDTGQVLGLVKKTNEFSGHEGVIRLEGDTYRFLKAPHPMTPGQVLVFGNTRSEKEILSGLIAALALTGLAAMALVFFGSLFLADRALVPIKKSWQRQRNFVADASHELRTPLAVMQTNLDLVMGNSGETVASQAVWLENINAENRRMARLVDDLLLLARADSDQQLMNFSWFDLGGLLEQVVKTFEPMAAEKHIRLEESIESPLEFRGDGDRLRQLAVILIDNAVRYTPPGGKVRVELKNRQKNVEITVADTGEGIDSDDIKKIFERFYRVDRTRSGESRGAGLGLAVADWIVKEHRGVVKVRSIPGEGSVFQILLPAGTPHVMESCPAN